jgi:hypothetical protein
MEGKMKKVIKGEEAQVVTLANIDERKIYACVSYDTIYKAHRVDDDRWAFISMEESICWANGDYSSLREVIKSKIGSNSIYEFDTTKEFLKWALEQV